MRSCIWLVPITSVAKGRDAALWNKACDLVVNQLLLDAGFSLPQGATHDPTYTGLSAEALYSELARLQDEPPNKGAERPEVQEETEQAEGGTGQSGEGKGESKDQKKAHGRGARRGRTIGGTRSFRTQSRERQRATNKAHGLYRRSA